MTRSLAIELAQNVRCNDIAPGYFATDANVPFVDNEDVIKFIENRIP